MLDRVAFIRRARSGNRSYFAILAPLGLVGVQALWEEVVSEDFRLKYLRAAIEIRHLKRIQSLILDHLELEKCRRAEDSVKALEVEIELDKLRNKIKEREK